MHASSRHVWDAPQESLSGVTGNGNGGGGGGGGSSGGGAAAGRAVSATGDIMMSATSWRADTNSRPSSGVSTQSVSVSSVSSNSAGVRCRDVTLEADV